MASYFGLDIGSSSVKIAYIDKDKVRVGLSINPVGKIGVDLSPEYKEKLVVSVRKLIEKSGIKSRRVVVGIPEPLVVSKILDFPVVSNAELAQAIKWQADQSIPLPPDQIDLSWIIVNKPKKVTGKEKMKVLVVAIPKKVSSSYVDFLGLLGLEPVRAENESLSLSRAMVVNKKQMGSVLVVDIGSSFTKAVLFDNLVIKSIYSFKIAGLAMTRALKNAFGLSLIQAEQYKRAYGVDKNLAEGKVYKALEVVLEGWLGEISRMIRFGSVVSVNKIVLVGGGAYLRGLVGVLSNKFSVEVVMGDVFGGKSLAGSGPELAVVYASAFGLASDEASL